MIVFANGPKTCNLPRNPSPVRNSSTRAAVRTTVQVGGYPGELRLRERAGREAVESVGVRMIRFVDGQDEALPRRAAPPQRRSAIKAPT
jgi:hypothetical protein